MYQARENANVYKIVVGKPHVTRKPWRLTQGSYQNLSQ